MFVPCTLCKKIMPFNERRIRNQKDYHRRCVWHIAYLKQLDNFFWLSITSLTIPWMSIFSLISLMKIWSFSCWIYFIILICFSVLLINSSYFIICIVKRNESIWSWLFLEPNSGLLSRINFSCRSVTLRISFFRSSNVANDIVNHILDITFSFFILNNFIICNLFTDLIKKNKMKEVCKKNPATQNVTGNKMLAFMSHLFVQ